MSIHYPGGVNPHESFEANQNKEEKKSAKRIFSAANRGMGFENGINQTNEYYLEQDLASIQKRPTPINIVKVDYSRGAMITHAYFEKQSTTDYNGVYKGHYIDFEAKSSENKTAFPLQNIAPQQIEHLKRVRRHGGIAFFIIHFAKLNETYVLDASYICDFYERRERKSIPIADIRKNGHLVEEKIRPVFDYLPILDEFFLK